MKKSAKILFVYRTARKKIYRDWKNHEGPDSLLFGANHLIKMGYNVDFFDSSYSPFNIFHPIFYPLEHSIISQTGMGFKIDQATVLLPKLRNYDIIIATGDSAGLPILALKYFQLINKPVIFMTAGLAGALRGKENTWVCNFYKKILNSADIFTSYSKIEIEFYENKIGIKKGKIIHIPLATDYEYFSKRSDFERSIICSVGTESGRDYKTLFEAVKGLNVKIEIACHPDNIRGLDIPKNVVVHQNIPVQEVLKIYQRSIISVVPCVERYRSSGQMVLLESAAAGLPIIASKISGLTSAFDFEDNKQLLYLQPSDPKMLREKIVSLLKNKKKSIKLGENARNLVRKRYSTNQFTFIIEKFMRQLL